ncbi:hypothetical protein GIB67_042243 [Kingdonia uniflora]|uniref:Nucleoside-diphosphate kinase n=1 Tax=Kingdonia uniflora TaxID=39325 RepID=A0A7J7LE59_9MAGN|nr:hypothetical protein GIB67_042243 [Kingdonia uniflora]
MAIHNIEITLGKGGQLARAAGAVVKLIAKEAFMWFTSMNLAAGCVNLLTPICLRFKLCSTLSFSPRSWVVNIIHGSDGLETAKDEINLWFKPEELVSYTSNEEKWVYGNN